jgi:hypothetical protein
MADLLRKLPIVWLPYIAAELFAICLWRLRGLVQSGIMHWFTTGHFVMDGEIRLTRDNLDAQSNATIACIPIGIAAVVLVVGLFVAALVATSAMVKSAEREQRPNAGMILAEIAAHWGAILLFALKFLVTFAVFAAGAVALSFAILFFAHRRYLPTSFWFLAGDLLISVGGTVWVVIPAAMRLLGADAAVVVSRRIRNQGAILAIVTAEVGAALGFLVPRLEASLMFDSRWEVVALSTVNSLIANAPTVAFFLSLALVSAGYSAQTDRDKASKIREHLSVLMPLHFKESEESPTPEE